MRTLLKAALVALISTSATTAMAAAFTIGLWGDMPYKKNKDEKWTQAVVDSMNKSDIAFSIYDGDIKDGSSKCTNDVYEWATKWFNSMKAPVIYVPGDNEWTDCHRTNNGGWNGLERLSHIRKTMFSSTKSFGQSKLELEHQGKPGEAYVENTRYQRGGVTFVGLNVPGSDNNYVKDDKSCTKKSARTLQDCVESNKEFAERDTANVLWLAESFAAAKRNGSKGVMIVFQGDPGFDLPETEDFDEAKDSGWNRDKSGYKKTIDAIIQQTEKFDGQVVIVHGDTHVFKVDKPLYAPLNLLPNLTRVQTFGSPNNHWIHVTVDVSRPEVFTFRPVMVKHEH
jgi:hypothetical protein